MNSNPLFIAVFIFIMMSAFTASAQTLESPLIHAGGVESHLYKSDTVMLENTVLEDGTGLPRARSLVAGVSLFYGQLISAFYIPLRYSLTDNFQLHFSLPYLTKNISTYEKSGYGDIKLGGSAFFRLLHAIDSTTSLNVTLPTGDEVAQDRGFIVPLGYGAHTISMRESLSGTLNSIPLRIFLALSGVFYASTTLDVDSSSRYIIDKTYSCAAVLGIAYYLGNFNLQCKLNYVYFPGRRYKYDNSNTGIQTSWSELNDSLQTSDLVPGVKYRFPDRIEGTVLAIIPIYQKTDSTIPDHGRREWKMFLGIEKSFISADGERGKTVPGKPK